MRIIVIDTATGTVKSVIRPEFTAAPFTAADGEGIMVDGENAAPLSEVTDAELTESWIYDAATLQFVPK